MKERGSMKAGIFFSPKFPYQWLVLTQDSAGTSGFVDVIAVPANPTKTPAKRMRVGTRELRPLYDGSLPSVEVAQIMQEAARH
jgi:hypothetical protein